MSRDKIHDKIDDLLAQLSINNSRLSLHNERLSQLDVDVLRKQCIDLYDQINRLALAGRQVQPAKKASPVVSEPAPEPIAAPEPVAEPEPQAKPEPPAEPVATEPKQPAAKPAPKPKIKEQEEDEMLSLFEKYNSKPIDSIPKAISVAKRFEFQSNFFDGEAKDYNEFMKKVDNAGDREAAFVIYHDYKDRLNWDNEELKDELKALLYRKYQG